MGLIDNTRDQGHEKVVLPFAPRGLNSSDEFRAESLAVWAVVVVVLSVVALLGAVVRSLL
jgi:hypothetical protein